MQRICNLIVLNEEICSHCKILILGWFMGQKVCNYSIYGHMFFGHNSAIFWPIGLEIFNVTQETISHKEFWFWALIAIFQFFGACLGLKRAWPPQIPIWVWDLKTQPKSWTTWWTFWVTCYLEIVYPTFLTLYPLKGKLIKCKYLNKLLQILQIVRTWWPTGYWIFLNAC